MAQYNPNQYNPNPGSEQREQIHVQGTDLADKVKELIHEGNVRRIIIRQDEHVIIEFPLAIGVVERYLPTALLRSYATINRDPLAFSASIWTP